MWFTMHICIYIYTTVPSFAFLWFRFFLSLPLPEQILGSPWKRGSSTARVALKETLRNIWCYRTAVFRHGNRSGSIAPNFLKRNPSETSWCYRTAVFRYGKSSGSIAPKFSMDTLQKTWCYRTALRCPYFSGSIALKLWNDTHPTAVWRYEKRSVRWRQIFLKGYP